MAESLDRLTASGGNVALKEARMSEEGKSDFVDHELEKKGMYCCGQEEMSKGVSEVQRRVPTRSKHNSGYSPR